MERCGKPCTISQSLLSLLACCFPSRAVYLLCNIYAPLAANSRWANQLCALPGRFPSIALPHSCHDSHPKQATICKSVQCPVVRNILISPYQVQLSAVQPRRMPSHLRHQAWFFLPLGLGERPPFFAFFLCPGQTLDLYEPKTQNGDTVSLIPWTSTPALDFVNTRVRKTFT